MPGTGSSGRWLASRGRRLTTALAAAVVAGLMAAAATPASATAATGRAQTGSPGRAQAVPALPASARFVGAPQVNAPHAGLRQACSTPATPGQMACMAVLPARQPAVRNGVRADASAPGGPAYDPAQLQNAYGLTSAATEPAAGETVAVVDAYNDPQASANLDAYRSAYGLPKCDQSNKCLTIMNQYGGTTDLPKADKSGGWSLEVSLDLDMVSAACPLCSIDLIEANSSSIASLATAERIAIRTGAKAVSNSWGSGAEFTGETRYDTDFYAPGVAITAAGGDNGYGTQYPAVSPYVTAVGGTTLTGSAGSWTQSAWSGSGSGCSELEPKPSWQTTDATSPGGCLNRTDNDVSAEANPNPGVWVYDTVKDPSAEPARAGPRSAAPASARRSWRLPMRWPTSWPADRGRR